ncbi:hypothetical protein L228DRAFT_160639 [Xylona heveae TC161]|uniref:Vacuolar protein sorting-associated protein 51 homolog n=1 Tax=Xylona heveae (strain CBS 132557 / TC161) TaxID=1328760 RepID=A0A165G7C4_XYLHT|nr:hypothetical protein L228DRAFT_160639 [Xylona heveae TC161]KZF21822.1 hypothetical protein L228DRAFT_160639 [Xylona heveae TC161]
MATMITSSRGASPMPRNPSDSRRTSVDTVTRSQASSPVRGGSGPPPSQAAQRRNRAALRDYYGLRSAAPADVSTDQHHIDAEIKDSELDREGLEPEKYVRELLGKESLEGVLKAEARLVNEIRSLDGERKALVYDNYSKLITATDTIRKMRSEMEPLTPSTSTLSPAIAHIAAVSEALAASLHAHAPPPTESVGVGKEAEQNTHAVGGTDQEKARQTVRWVLNTPFLLQQMISEGRSDEADREWEDVRKLLDKWNGTPGVEKVRKECESVLRKDAGT